MKQSAIPRLVLAAVALPMLGGPLACHAQDGRAMKAIAELVPEDDLTVDKKVVAEECSKALANRAAVSADAVADALRQRALAYAYLKDWRKAKADLDDLVSLRPRDVEALWARVRVLVLLEMLQDAKRGAEEMSRIAPRDPRTYFALGYTSVCLDELRDGISYLDKSISLDNTDARAFFARGVAYQYIDPARCLDDLNKGLELSPYMPDPLLAQIHFARGFSLNLLNRPRQALSSLLVALKADPKSFDVNNELALAYASLGKYHLAARYAEKLVGISPKDPIGHALCAIYYAKTNRLGDAKAYAAKIPNLDADGKVPHCLIADAHRATGDYAAALRYYNAALKENEDHFSAMVGKASLIATCPDASLRDGALAVEIATRALKRKKTRDFQKWAPTMALAEAHAECGDFAKAVDLAKQAITLAGTEFGRRQEFLDKLALFEKKMPYRMKPISDGDGDGGR